MAMPTSKKFDLTVDFNGIDENDGSAGQFLKAIPNWLLCGKVKIVVPKMLPNSLITDGSDFALFLCCRSRVFRQFQRLRSDPGSEECGGYEAEG